VTKPLKKGASYDDLIRVPEHFVAEMLDGELYASPRPAFPHARAAGVLHARIGDAFDFGRGPGGWFIFIEPELHFGNDVLVPDIAGWRRERLPSVPEDAFATVVLEAGSFTQLAEHHGKGTVRAAPFDEIELELQSLWAG
jgi:hypothetical protein